MDEAIRTAAISPLRQRLIEDMTMRRISLRTEFPGGERAVGLLGYREAHLPDAEAWGSVGRQVLLAAIHPWRAISRYAAGSCAPCRQVQEVCRGWRSCDLKRRQRISIISVRSATSLSEGRATLGDVAVSVLPERVSWRIVANV